MLSLVKTLPTAALVIFFLSACGGSSSQDQAVDESGNSQSEQSDLPEDLVNSDSQDDGNNADEGNDASGNTTDTSDDAQDAEEAENSQPSSDESPPVEPVVPDTGVNTPSDTSQDPADESESELEGGVQDPQDGADSSESDTQDGGEQSDGVENNPESPDDTAVDEESDSSTPSNEESSPAEPGASSDSNSPNDTPTDISDTTPNEEPVAQTLNFSITSSHSSQALDGYVQVAGWAKDFQNSTGGSNLQFQIDLRSSADMFTRTPTISYPSGTLRYEVKPSAEGRVLLFVSLIDIDTGVESATKAGTFNILPAPMNVAPSFVGGGNRTTQNDAGAQAFAGWASGMQDNNTEAVQKLSFKVVSLSNRSFFTAIPSVSYPSGTLRYTPKAGALGTATIKLVLEDDGVGTYGGEDTSAEYEFTITITAPPESVVVNKAPSFKNLGNQTVEADSGAFLLSAWAYDLDDGNDGTQSLSFEVVSNSNPGLFSAPPTVSVPSGTLRFTPEAGESGTAEISIRLKDNGGVENGGVDVSGMTTLVLNIETIVTTGLPPDPGEKGRETLLGIDLDNDGVRDDVQLAILSLYGNEPEDTQENLLNAARLFQEVFIDTELGSELDVKNNLVKILEIVSCAELTYEQTTMLELLMVNTEDRSQKYIEANALMLGVSMQAHGAESDYCEF